MKILVSGGTGFIGRALCQHLQKSHDIVIKTRQPSLVEPHLRAISDMHEIKPEEAFDVVINLAGEPIANKRWSTLQKKKILESRVNTTEELIAYFKNTEHKPKLFISGSAIGYYGIENSEQSVHEDDHGDNSFSSTLCEKWEKAARQAEALGIRTCLLRTGIVLGNNGGALQKMLFPFKLGLGGHIGAGTQWQPWIHMADMVGIIEHCIINPDISGAINCTAPNPVTNKTFSQTLGTVLKRPTLFNMPAALIKVLMGQMGEELLLSGKKVLPDKAIKSGYVFQFSHFESALVEVLETDHSPRR